MSLLTREIEIVREYLQVKYQLRGRTVESGLDCYGLIVAIYEDHGFELLDIEEEYDEDWSWAGRNYFIESYHLHWSKTERPEFLDVVLFRNAKGIANHAGVMLRGDRFLHCSKIGVTIGRLSDAEWERRFEGFYHLKARKQL